MSLFSHLLQSRSYHVAHLIATYAPVLEAWNGVIAHLDVIISLAHVAVNAPETYVKPEILEKGSPVAASDT